MAKYKNTVIGTQLDPQYGWVTADVKKSQNFDPISAAKNLYSSMYGNDALTSRIKSLKTVPKNSYTVASYDGMTDDYRDYKNLMSWYYAASNPQYQQNQAYKDLVDYYSLAFNKSQDNAASQVIFRGGEQAGLFGKFGLNYRQDPYSQLVKQYGQQGVENAKAAIMAAGMVDPSVNAPSLGSVLENAPGNAYEQYTSYLNKEGGLPGGFNNPATTPVFDDRDTRSMFKGSAFLASFDPNLYGNATLNRYFEGSNPNLLSMNGMPWQGVNDPKNYSWSRGGEFLADEAFQYYKNKSTPGMAGTNWAPVGTNSNLLTGTFDGRQSFFTPYEYAIKGIPDEQAKVTNISAADPNFWAQQGNLQNINNQWGFVTQQDPYAGLASSNLALQPDTLTATLRQKKGGGFLSGLLNSIPSLGLSLIPGVGPFASIASGIQGIGSAVSFFDKDKNPQGPGSWYQPSIYPNYIR